MTVDLLKILIKVLPFVIVHGSTRIVQKISAYFHYKSYKPVKEAQTVLVIGGSFAGISLVQRLCETLPTGYRLILVEPNSHFNYMFNFPRFSVIKGYEELAFFPYDNLERLAPTGLFQRIQARVVSLNVHTATLDDGQTLAFAYAIVATGSHQSPGSSLVSGT